jgi:hypothetical protein
MTIKSELIDAIEMEKLLNDEKKNRIYDDAKRSMCAAIYGKPKQGTTEFIF